MIAISSENMSANAATKRLRKFLEDGGFTVPMLLDDGAVFRDYGIQAVPSVVVIDREGKVVELGISGRAAREAVKQLLES